MAVKHQDAGAGVIFGSDGSSANGKQGTKADEKNLKNLSFELRFQRIMTAVCYAWMFQIVFFGCLIVLFKYPDEKVDDIIDASKTNGNAADQNYFWLINILVSFLCNTMTRILSAYASIELFLILSVVFLMTSTIGMLMEAQKYRPVNKIERLKFAFSRRVIVGTLLFGILFSILIKCYLRAINWEYKEITFVSDVKGEDGSEGFIYYFNENHFFFYLMSFSIGVYLFLDWNNLRKGFILEFPSIEQNFEEVCRIALIDCALDSVTFLFKTLTPLYLVIYCFQRGLFHPLISNIGYIYETDHILYFLDITLWFQIGFWNTIVIYFVKLSHTLIHFTMTEQIYLTLNAFPWPRYIVYLTDAMNSTDDYMQHLGFHSFKIMANPHSSDIKSFLEISHPGGQAKNWIGVCKATLDACNELTTVLTGCYQPKRLSFSIFGSQESSQKSSRGNVGGFYAGQGILEDPDANNLRNRSSRASMRYLAPPTNATASPAPMFQSPVSFARMVILSPVILWKSLIFEAKRNFWLKFSWLKLIKIDYEKSSPDLVVYNALAKYQVVLWGINGLLSIIEVSKEMDTHGVVQRDLRKVIQTIVDLHRALISFFSASPIESENVHGIELIAEACLYTLVKIHSNFRNHYEILNLPDEYKIRVEQITRMELKASPTPRSEYRNLYFNDY